VEGGWSPLEVEAGAFIASGGVRWSGRQVAALQAPPAPPSPRWAGAALQHQAAFLHQAALHGSSPGRG
jgi:hypothetical protein